MASPNNLPHHLSSFVGRESELEEVRRQLGTARLLTLTGPGGAGKTRLALRVLAGELDTHPDGVWLVELAALTDGALVPQAIASAVGLREESGRPVPATLARFFGDRSVLLALDNCEHLTAACAALAEGLLRKCANLRVLATSRQALGVAGEVVWQVPPLSTPNAAQTYSPEELLAFEAVQLFVTRARLARAEFAITAQNAAAVARLTGSLDGLPLAIELAAARMKVLSVEQIVARLDRRFRLLAAPGAGLQPRQQTLRALMDWSYELLSEPERSLLHALAVFAGGSSLPAVAAVYGAADEYDLIDLLSHLADKSLLIVEEQSGEARYRQLDTIREYAMGKLVDAGADRELRSRHREWYLRLAEYSENEMIAGSQAAWLAQLEVEHANLRAALEWSRHEAQAGAGSDRIVRLAGALVWFWYFRGYLTEGRQWLESALALARTAGDNTHTPSMAKALSAAGALAFLQSDHDAARTRLEDGLLLWRELGEDRGTGFAAAFLARVLERQGHSGSTTLAEESATIFRALNERWGLALVLDFLGEQARMGGDFGKAAGLHDQALTLYRELGHAWGVALELSNLGRVALAQGELATAGTHLDDALAMLREVGDKWGQAQILETSAAVAAVQHRAGEAIVRYNESLALYVETDDAGGMARVKQSLADLAQEAVEQTGSLQVALQPEPSPNGSVNYPEGLTRREVEVLRLVADGLTDVEIAGRLFLSARTVQAHLRSIYSKIDVTSRSAATRYALTHGLA